MSRSPEDWVDYLLIPSLQLFQPIVSHLNNGEGSASGAIRSTCHSMRDKFDSCNQKLVLGGRKTAQAAAMTEDAEDEDVADENEQGGSSTAVAISKEKPDLALLAQVIQRTPDLSDLSFLPTITWHQASKLMFKKTKTNGSKSKAASSSGLPAPVVPNEAIRSGLSRLSLVSCSNLNSLTVLQSLAPSLSHLNIRLDLGSSGCLKG